MSVVLRRGSIVRYRGQGIAAYRTVTPSPCQSAAAASNIVKRCCSRVFSCKQRYIKYPDLYIYLYNGLDYSWSLYIGPVATVLPSTGTIQHRPQMAQTGCHRTVTTSTQTTNGTNRVPQNCYYFKSTYLLMVNSESDKNYLTQNFH